ncbi:hypothetical protein N7541_007991 [Penicillium brevicompactum]|uniref:Uncharacterized protein n=1 Tax=Penicillium brevicompactum TaxID=5074 RepID=A0A9W9R0I5_PENBR|nr:hypothetical protein N7541_007991 [Penicillium brevicompactum]
MSVLTFQVWLAFFLLSTRHVQATLRTYHFTLHSAQRSPDGFPREVYLINGQQPGPMIDVEEGDDLEVFVQNELPVETTIHWHGLLQRGSPKMDGVPGVTQYPISPGGNFTYRFSVGNEYGFFWYHSHFRAYYNDAIRGPLLIRPSSSRRRPFENLASNGDERDAMLEAERNATSVLLNDWTHELSDTIYARYFETGAFPHCVDSILANGLGRVECLPEYILDAGPGLGLAAATSGVANTTPASMSSSVGMDMSGMMKRMMDSMPDTMSMEDQPSMPIMSLTESSHPTMATTDMVSMAGSTGMAQPMKSLGPRGCTPPMMFRNGYNVSSLPSETCVNTTARQLKIPAKSSQGWLALNLVNSGAVSAIRVSLDAHSMLVYAADGLYVTPQEVKVLPIAIGQRYSVMIKLDQPEASYYLRFATYPSGDMQQVLEGQAIVSYISDAKFTATADVSFDSTSSWMFTNGSAKHRNTELVESKLSPFEGNKPPPKAADVTRLFEINQTDIVTWVVDRYPYSEPKIPVIYGNVSDAWQANTTLHMPSNSTVDIVMSVANGSMDAMGHPMHLHGHKFWVLGSGTGTFPYRSLTDAPSSVINLENPPYRDTTDLPPSGWLAVRYITDNPGAWLLHCHFQWHIVSGMALVLVEGQDQLPGLVGSAPPNTSKTNPSQNSSISSPSRTGSAWVNKLNMPGIVTGLILVIMSVLM